MTAADYKKARESLEALSGELTKMKVGNSSGHGLFRPALRSITAFMVDHEADAREQEKGAAGGKSD